jgi:hypothetical protein
MEWHTDKGRPIPEDLRDMWPHFSLSLSESDRPPVGGLELGNGWRATFEFVAQAGQFVVKKMTITHDDPVPAGGLPRRMVRSITPAKVARLAREVLREKVDDSADSQFFRLHLAPHGFAPEPGPAPRPGHPGRRGRPPLQLAEAAETYVNAIRDGRHPKQAVADQHHLSTSGADSLLRAARIQGYLTDDAAPGIAGGGLTEMALEVLRARDEERGGGAPSTRKRATRRRP